MMMNTEEWFASEAQNAWDLERLYTDLAKAKGRALSPTEKLYLRGLLSGHSPAEIAKKCHKSAGGVKVYLSTTVYQYVKFLANKENEKLENWTNIRKWLEGIGYKRSSSDKKNIFKFHKSGNNNTRCQNVNSPSTGETELKHELEKAHLINEQLQKEIDYLKQQVNLLNQMVNMLKSGE